MMQRFKLAVATFCGIVGIVYLATLIFFVIDTAKVANETRNIANSFNESKIEEGELLTYSKDIARYSKSLKSPLYYFPSLATGDYRNFQHLASTLSAGSKVLEVIAPLIENQKSNDLVFDFRTLIKGSKELASISNDITDGFLDFSKVKLSGVLTPIKSDFESAQSKVSKFEELFKRVSPILPVMPEILGENQKRKYFVAMQNSAQGRGTGGLLGTFAIVSVDKGKPTIELVEPNEFLEIQSDIPITVPDEYRVIYSDFAKSWNGSNFSPHFPYAAKIWLETWRRMTGEKLDGVISIDTFTLKAILAATGPISTKGFELSEQNVIPELLSNAYKVYEGDPGRRKQYLAEVARKIGERVIAGNISKPKLVREMISPIIENRLLIYSPYPKEAKAISKSLLSGILSNKENNEYRLVIQNIAGNKMDYYIKKELAIMSERCKPIRTTRVDFKITNTADSNEKLPPYVNSLRAQGYPLGKKNSQFVGIFLYGPSNSTVTGAFDVDTGQTYGSLFVERNRSLYSVQTMIPAGKSKSFSVFFEGGVGDITTITQPLVIPQETIIEDSCKS